MSGRVGVPVTPLARWRDHAEHRLADRATTDVARIVVRSLECLVGGVGGVGGVEDGGRRRPGPLAAH